MVFIGKRQAEGTRGGLRVSAIAGLTLAVCGTLWLTPAAAFRPAVEPIGPVVPTDDAPSGIRNVVMILADDLDSATFEQVPRLRALHAQGLTFTNVVVTDSLCCPSRSSILRSQYVHNHGVVSNMVGSGGGWRRFNQHGKQDDCLPVWLHRANVHTGFLGKYLNGYGGSATPLTPPPGWDRWFVPVTQPAMYRGYGYTVNSDGRLVTYGYEPTDLLSDVLNTQAQSFIDTASSPFYLQINPTSPHGPAPVALRHRHSEAKVEIPRTAAFNRPGIGAPHWRASKPYIGPRRLARYDQLWRQRARSSESLADLVDGVRAALKRSGQLDSTLIVLTSDNGYHAASRRLPPGKQTPYYEDTVVPMVVLGPGVPAGKTVDAMTSTVDLGPTFASLLGAPVPDWTDGRSLVPFLHGGGPAEWRTGVITEHLSRAEPGDPDYQAYNPPPYRALRTRNWLYVEYVDGARELFDRVRDPAEVDNVVDTTAPEIVAGLAEHLHQLEACAGHSCWVADSWAEDADTV